MANEVVFKYKVEMSYVDGKVEPIPSSAIRMLMIDYDYVNTDGIHAPVAAATVNIGTIMYNKMQTSTNGKILLKISKYKDSDPNPVPITYIEKQLKYHITDEEVESEVETDKQDDGGSYRCATLVLYNEDDVNLNKKFTEQNYVATNTMTIIALNAGLPIIIEPFENNPTIDRYIPPMQSVYKFFNYLNFHWTFYKTGFRFFQNWDNKAYLISFKGNPIDINDGTYLTNKIKVSKQPTLQGNLQGMDINPSQVYIIEVDSKDTTVSTNEFTPCEYGRLYCIMRNGSIIQRPLNIHNKNGGNKTKVLKLETSNPDIVENLAFQYEYTGTTFTFTKANIDTSIIVPYKGFMVEMLDSYAKESGKYILVSKKETYVQDGDGFMCSIVATLRKAP